ncbi:putative ORMDL family protein [Helianthus anomalus]
MANLYVQAVPPTDLNRNTEWFMYPGVWTTYILILFFAWLVVLSVTGCSPGMAWTTVNLCHALVCDQTVVIAFVLSVLDRRREVELGCGASCWSFILRLIGLSIVGFRVSEICDLYLGFEITYHFFHWKKGTPFADDQGIYNRLTWWEQIDSGKQLTRNRKFLTVVPVVLLLECILLSV